MIKDIHHIRPSINTVFKFTMLTRVMPAQVNKRWLSFKTKNHTMCYMLLSESSERASIVIIHKNVDEDKIKHHLKSPSEWDLSEVKMFDKFPDYKNGTIRPLFAYYDPRIPINTRMLNITLRNPMVIKRMTKGERHGDIITNESMTTAMMPDQKSGEYAYHELTL